MMPSCKHTSSHPRRSCERGVPYRGREEEIKRGTTQLTSGPVLATNFRLGPLNDGVAQLLGYSPAATELLAEAATQQRDLSARSPTHRRIATAMLRLRPPGARGASPTEEPASVAWIWMVSAAGAVLLCAISIARTLSSPASPCLSPNPHFLAPLHGDRRSRNLLLLLAHPDVESMYATFSLPSTPLPPSLSNQLVWFGN